MDSLLSFPVGLFHPLQHAGLSRRSPVSRLIGMWLVPGTSRRERLQATHDRVPGYAGGHGQVLVQGERAEYHWTLIGTNTEPRRHGTPGSDQWLRALADGTDGLIASSQGHFDSSEYQRQLQGGGVQEQR